MFSSEDVAALAVHVERGVGRGVLPIVAKAKLRCRCLLLVGPRRL